MKTPTLPYVEGRYLVCGSRDARDKGPTWRALDKRRLLIRLVIVGGAPGVDTFAEQWCKKHGVPCARMDAQWDYYGKIAGPMRNGWMLELLKPDRVLALPGGRGTADMIAQARAAGVPVTRIGWKRNARR